MHGIYTYIPETNFVTREYSVAAILLLLFMVLISLVSVLNLLYFYISTFRSMCAVPNMAVFCSSLTSCFPGMLLTYFLNDFEIVPVAPIIIIIIIIIIIMELHECFIRILRPKLFMHGAAPTRATCFTKVTFLVLMIAAVVEKGILEPASLYRIEAIGHYGACLLGASNFP